MGKVERLSLLIVPHEHECVRLIAFDAEVVKANV